jgi:hypothetical protein
VFNDQVSFELRERGEDVKHQSTLRAGGIDGVVQAFQADILLHQGTHKIDKISQGTTETIQFPDHEDVAGAHPLQQAPEDGPFGFRTTGGFLQDLLTARLPELVDLKIQVLISRGDASVAEFHARSLANSRQ